MSDTYLTDPLFGDVGDEPTPEETPGNTFDFTDEVKEDSPKEKAPTVHHARESAKDLITLLYGGFGTALVQTGKDIPVGRVLQFQAPLAGARFDELIANTWLDSLIQPLVRGADKVEGLGSLILFPLLIGAYERNPSIAPVAEGILRQVVRSTLVEMAPILKKREAEDRKAAKAMADLNDVMDFGDMPKGTDPIDAVLAAIFAPIGGEPVEGDGLDGA